MKKSLAVLLSVIALLLTACYEADDEFTINADGSGKVTFVRIIKVMGSPDQILRMTVANIVKKWQGVEAWKDISFELQDDGRGRIKGTAYFPDIRKFSDSEDIDALKGVSFTRSGDQGLRIVLGEPAAEPEKSSESGTAAKVAVLSDDELKKAIREKRAEYQAQKPMMEMVLKDLKIERRFRLPGKITKLSALQKQSDSVARYSLDGAKLLQAMDQAMMDDKFMSVSVHVAAGQESAVSIPPGLKEKMFGESGPAAVEVAGELKDLFDYQAEVRTAKSAEEVLMSVEPATTTPSASAPAPSLPVGDVAVTASAQARDDQRIDVRLVFKGGAAAEAGRFGKIQISAEPEGTGARRLEMTKFGLRSKLPSGFDAIDRSRQRVHPDDGFAMTVTFQRPEQEVSRISRIAGTVSLQSMGRIVVADIGARLSGAGKVELHDPGLDALGSFSISRDGNELHLHHAGREAQPAWATLDVLAADGKSIECSGGSAGRGPGGQFERTLRFPLGDRSLAGARLEVVAPKAEVVVPFELKDVPVNHSPGTRKK